MDLTLHRIMDLMWKRNLSEIDFCTELGINKSSVTDWKRGKTTSYKRYLPEIAELLNTSVEYLLGKVAHPQGDAIESSNYKERDHMDLSNNALILLARMMDKFNENLKKDKLEHDALRLGTLSSFQKLFFDGMTKEDAKKAFNELWENKMIHVWEASRHIFYAELTANAVAYSDENKAVREQLRRESIYKQLFPEFHEEDTEDTANPV